MVDRIPARAKKITVAAQGARREPRQPQPLLEGGGERLVVERLAGRRQDLEERKYAQELFVAGKVARHGGGLVPCGQERGSRADSES